MPYSATFRVVIHNNPQNDLGAVFRCLAEDLYQIKSDDDGNIDLSELFASGLIPPAGTINLIFKLVDKTNPLLNVVFYDSNGGFPLQTSDSRFVPPTQWVQGNDINIPNAVLDATSTQMTITYQNHVHQKKCHVYQFGVYDQTNGVQYYLDPKIQNQ